MHSWNIYNAPSMSKMLRHMEGVQVSLKLLNS